MDSIYTECKKFVHDRVEAGVITRTDWMTSEYLGTKDRVEGDDLPFYRVCAIAHVNEVMKQVVGKYDSKKERADSQLVFPGFSHMQKAYTVQRDGIRLLVPVSLLTDEEIEARAAQYDEMAQGCRDHARELREFKSARGASEAA
jgi:hypothetical protein